MNKALPTIEESEEQLQAMLRRETHSAKKQRLHALYLLKSGQARSRVRVAALLSVNRNTVGEWLRTYQTAGLPALLTIGQAPGREPTLDHDQRAQLQAALARPQGFGSYGEIQQWIADELGVPMPYKTVHHVVRYQLKAKLKQPRPVHAQKKWPTK